MIDDALLNRLDLPSAVEAELMSRTRLMPSRWDYMDLLNVHDKVVSWIRPQLRRRGEGQAEQVLLADKDGRGSRPLTELRLEDAVLYRAIVHLLQGQLPDGACARPPIASFRKAPIDHLVDTEMFDSAYVVKTDVTAYYEFVDHTLLADELIGQTGDQFAVEALIALLQHIMNRNVGLPQVHSASDILGDLYIDPARRRLRRKGYAVWTYSDDFLIAAPDLRTARIAIESCSREARALGLVLNERKTYTYRAATYQRSLSAFDKAEHRLFTDMPDGPESLLPLNEEYGIGVEDGDDDQDLEAIADSDDVDDATASEQSQKLETDAKEVSHDLAAAAERAWDLWRGAHEGRELERAVKQSLLGRALPILGKSHNDAPMEELSRILSLEPSLTPQVAEYLIQYVRAPITSLADPPRRVRASQARRALDTIVGEQVLNNWQGVWIAYVAGMFRGTRSNRKHIEWLEECVAFGPDPLSATASAALGRLSIGDPSEIAASVDRLGPQWRRLAIWGLSQIDANSAREYCEDDGLSRLLTRFEEVSTQDAGRSTAPLKQENSAGATKEDSNE
ncbi:RNA-directed DNA polymerase [Gordonia lacunae]|uniref:RNA-directed DNA polymerase n=1 Tax=Gordonia lacunae TaxID=417102 RepID=UPI001183D2E9|nr:RNA-directed DNA polymerase [Gordonia lacunae]